MIPTNCASSILCIIFLLSRAKYHTIVVPQVNPVIPPTFTCERTYLAPVRDEEAESQRKAKSRLARRTRRSTQVKKRNQIKVFFLLDGGGAAV